MSKSLYAAIPLIMERFDFKQVQKVMEFLNWKWANTAAGNAAPSIEELRAEAYRQLDQCIDLFERQGRPATGMNVASGGFQALVNVFASGNVELELLFYVDAKSSNGEY